MADLLLVSHTHKKKLITRKFHTLLFLHTIQSQTITEHLKLQALLGEMPCHPDAFIKCQETTICLELGRAK